MKSRHTFLIFIASLTMFAPLLASPIATSPSDSGTFQSVDIYIDAHGKPLSAYQFEFKMDVRSTLVGIEGGETDAYKPAPYYDPRALSHNRVVIAAFTLSRDVPTGPTRVARLHVFNETGAPLNSSATLDIAGTIDGSAIPATVSIREGVAQ